MRTLPPGLGVTVEVPATSANLGPGFDCFGLALDWRDRAQLEVVADGFCATVTGEGAGSLPTDSGHLVLSSARRALEHLGFEVPGLALTAHNTIPHGRGLGSSSAAITAGLVAAGGLVSALQQESAAGPASAADWLPLATDIEGHPDNVAAALLGGFVLAYRPSSGSVSVKAITARVRGDVRTLVFVPEQPMSTHRARGLLPASVPHDDAAANSGRAAMLLHALTDDPSLLFEATVDRLHQTYRSAAMPASMQLVESLRDNGIPAVISGAGPSVLVLGRADAIERARSFAAIGFQVSEHAIGPGAQIVATQTRQHLSHGGQA